MAVNKKDLHALIDLLNDADTISAYDYLQYLINWPKRKRSPIWSDIAKLAPDEEPFSDEEQRQLGAPDDYITLEEATKEYGI